MTPTITTLSDGKALAAKRSQVSRVALAFIALEKNLSTAWPPNVGKFPCPSEIFVSA